MWKLGVMLGTLVALTMLPKVPADHDPDLRCPVQVYKGHQVLFREDQRPYTHRGLNDDGVIIRERHNTYGYFWYEGRKWNPNGPYYFAFSVVGQAQACYYTLENGEVVHASTPP